MGEYLKYPAGFRFTILKIDKLLILRQDQSLILQPNSQFWQAAASDFFSFQIPCL
jgi:virulence-associated protein VagC